MTLPTAPDTAQVADDQSGTAHEPAFPCETCGVNRATHVLADLTERDTSLFCGSCLVLTMAQVANDLIAQDGA